jgi:6-phosphogluconate dehydrogenase
VEASPLVADSLLARFASHQGVSPAVKAIAALRNQFDGHAVKKATDVPSPHS